MRNGKMRRKRKREGGTHGKGPAPSPLVEVAKTASGREIKELILQPIPLPSSVDIVSHPEKIFDISQSEQADSCISTDQKGHQSSVDSGQDFSDIKNQLFSQIREQAASLKDEQHFGDTVTKEPVKQTQNIHQIRDKLLSQIRNQVSKDSPDTQQNLSQHRELVIEKASKKSPNNEGKSTSKKWNKKLAENIGEVRNRVLDQIRNLPVKSHNFESVEPTLVIPLAKPDTMNPVSLLTSNQHFSPHTVNLPLSPKPEREDSSPTSHNLPKETFSPTSRRRSLTEPTEEGRKECFSPTLRIWPTPVEVDPEECLSPASPKECFSPTSFLSPTSRRRTVTEPTEELYREGCFSPTLHVWHTEVDPENSRSGSPTTRTVPTEVYSDDFLSPTLRIWPKEVARDCCSPTSHTVTMDVYRDEYDCLSPTLHVWPTEEDREPSPTTELTEEELARKECFSPTLHIWPSPADVAADDREDLDSVSTDVPTEERGEECLSPTSHYRDEYDCLSPTLHIWPTPSEVDREYSSSPTPHTVTSGEGRNECFSPTLHIWPRQEDREDCTSPNSYTVSTHSEKLSEIESPHQDDSLIQHFMVLPDNTSTPTEIYFKGSGYNGSSGSASPEDTDDSDESTASTVITVVSEIHGDQQVEFSEWSTTYATDEDIFITFSGDISNEERSDEVSAKDLGISYSVDELKVTSRDLYSSPVPQSSVEGPVDLSSPTPIQETQLQSSSPPLSQSPPQCTSALPDPPTELELFGYESSETDQVPQLALHVESCQWGTTYSAPQMEPQNLPLREITDTEQSLDVEDIVSSSEDEINVEEEVERVVMSIPRYMMEPGYRREADIFEELAPIKPIIDEELAVQPLLLAEKAPVRSLSDALDDAIRQAGLVLVEDYQPEGLVDYNVSDKLTVAALVEIFSTGTASLDIEELCKQVAEGTQSVLDEHVPSDLLEDCSSLASSADDIMTVLEGEGQVEVVLEEVVVPDKSWTSLGGEGSVQ